MFLQEVSKLDLNNTTSQNFGVMNFAYDLTQKMKGFKVAVRDTQSSWVYREGDNYVMGIIGFGDFQGAGDGKDRYGVWSPNVINRKYTHGPQTNMCLALKRDKAVKNAAKYLRPLSLVQTVKLSAQACGRAASDVVTQVRNNVGDTRQKLTENLFDTGAFNNRRENALQRELKHLVDSGYEFIDKELGDRLKSMFAGLTELNAARDALEGRFTFVEAFVSPTGRQMFRVATELDTSRYYTLDVPQENTALYSQEELPEHIMGKLSVLSMIDVGNYVEGVGYRAADRVFYIR